MDKQKLYSLTRQAIKDYDLIEEGDKIAIGVSGGKDSLALLVAMAGLQSFFPKHFDIMAITCDIGFEGMNYDEISALCKSLSIPYEIVRTHISDIVFSDENSASSPCSLCAKLRKGAMYDRLVELGYKKIAYAHHKDDFVETALLSLLYEGRFYSFPPSTTLDKTGITVIRPLMYVPEKSIEVFVKKENLPVLHNTCPVDGSTKRAYVKNLISEIRSECPEIKDRILHAIMASDFDDWPKLVK